MIEESFFIGGEYVETANGKCMTGQAYVQRRAGSVTRPYPIVMIHGGRQTAMNFETTPDGRPGWAPYFVNLGYDVYLVDRPGNGRSTLISETFGPPAQPFPAHRVEQQFTAVAKYGLWPQAHLHTQWPGPGVAGDPVFDQFYASQSSEIEDQRAREFSMRTVGAELLDRIGPSILLTHSQSGAYGWVIADERPNLTKGILAVEAASRPFYKIVRVGPPNYFEEGTGDCVYGLTATPIAYDPPVIDPAIDLPFYRQETPDGPDLVCCYYQQEPARRLVNISRVPVICVDAEASFHAASGHCGVNYLRQAGVEVDHIMLADRGIHGNGHMMMLEKNSDEVAALLHETLQAHDLA